MSDEQYLDPKEIYGDEQDSWTDYWDYSVSLYENLANLCSQATLLPHASIQLPIAATYLLIPSKWARVLPILFSYGEKGSGKSTFATIGGKLHGLPQSFSPNDTFPSLRNSLDLMRWIDPESKQFEKDGAMLCWDNVRVSTFINDPRVYQMCLFGYSRATDKIQIAQSDGTNKTFNVFSPKVMSSIDALHTNHEFVELQRRLMTIYHKPYERFTVKEKEGKDIDLKIERIDPDSINWTDFDSVFFNFWDKRENCRLYAQTRVAMTRKGKKPYGIPKSILAEQWTISIDLICTGLLVGSWSSVQEGIDIVGRYWEFINERQKVTQGSTYQLLLKWINAEFGNQIKSNNELVSQGLAPIPVLIPGRRVKEALTLHHNNGELDIVPNFKSVSEIMGALGWRLNAGNWEQK